MYDYPAPGLNNGRRTTSPAIQDWTPALFAVASRGDLDDGSIVLRRPMPDWLVTPVGGHVLTTQDFADIYAYLLTQM